MQLDGKYHRKGFCVVSQIDEIDCDVFTSTHSPTHSQGKPTNASQGGIVHHYKASNKTSLPPPLPRHEAELA
jgi:hypothetical protein